jgi:adenylosuccinate lyase
MAGRYTDARVPEAGIRALFARPHRWQRWLDVEAALAAAEADAGIVPPEAAAAIAAAAYIDKLDRTRLEQRIAAMSHPLMPLVTTLADAVGEAHGGWVHWGATTQNITQTGDAVVLAEAHSIVLNLLADILEAAADVTAGTADMVAAGRTHGQHAVPITFGFKVAGWIEELCRSVDRLRAVEPRALTAMTGGAVGTFASLGPAGPLVQAGVADRLGLIPMTIPTRASGDGFAEYVVVLGLLAASGGRIAHEVYELMKTEFGEAFEPAPPGTIGSSTMPHKRNPQLADDCIAISAEVRALVPLALEATLHDHEVDGAHTAMLQDALERACVLSGDLLVRLHTILNGLTVDEDRMRANLGLTGGLITSEAVMLALGRRIGRQVAHEVVYEATRTLGPGTTFAAALRADSRITDHLADAELDALLDPSTHVGLSADLARASAAHGREVAGEIRRRQPARAR